MIATHDSITGEKPKNIWAYLGYPFAKTQCKTIKEQFEQGVRMFDLRCAYDTNGVLVMKHGLARFGGTLKETLELLYSLADIRGEMVYVLVTYEGKLGNVRQFLGNVVSIVGMYNNVIQLMTVNVKLPTWNEVYRNKDCKAQFTQDYAKIVGWKKILPIPFVWWLFSKKKKQYTTDIFSMRDFV